MDVAGTAVSGFSFLALAAEVEGAGVLPVEDGVGGFSAFSLGFSFSLNLSTSRSLGGSGRGAVWVVEEVAVDVEVDVRLEWETDVLVCAGLDEAKEDEEEGLLGNPDVGKLGEGTLAPGMFRRFGGFGEVKAETENQIQINAHQDNESKYSLHLLVLHIFFVFRFVVFILFINLI